MFKICKGLGVRVAMGAAFCALGAATAWPMGSVAGEAYWGSFGERTGRIEGVFIRTVSDGVFIGFDEESKTGAFSFDVDWNSEERFELRGFSRSEDSPESQPTRGTGRMFASSEGPLLESALEEIDLNFEAFEKGGATLSRYRLEGETQGELILALGEAGRSFGLFLGDDGYVFGSQAKTEEGKRFRFETNRGDRFEGESADALTSYRLSDGRQGKVTSLLPEALEAEPIALRSVWSYSRKAEGASPDVLHFILSGSGTTEVTFETVVRGDVRSGSWASAESAMTLEIFRLEDDGEWQSQLESAPMVRLKGGVTHEFETVFSGYLPSILGEGTYLAQLNGSDALAAEVEIVANIESSEELKAINGSVLYYCGGQASDHRFGFDLRGEGVASSLIRNVGPGLDYFDMSDCAIDPSLAVYREGTKRWKNEDWNEGAGAALIASRGDALGAFPLEEASADAAIALSLGQGRYEALAQGSSDRVGFEIIELYCGFASEGIQ